MLPNRQTGCRQVCVCQLGPLLANSQFTHNNSARVDTTAGFKASCPKVRQSGQDVEARLHCTLSGILVGPRIVEIGGHAIADEEADPPHAIGLLRSDASGHAPAALPIRVRNSRRLIRLPHSSWTSEQQSGSSTDQNANATSISFRQ